MNAIGSWAAALVWVLVVLSGAAAAWAQALERMPADELAWDASAPLLDQRSAIVKALEVEASDALRFELARVEHLLGARGDRELAQSALGRLEDLAERYPDDPFVTGYLGSATMLRAERVWWFLTKGKLVERGGELLERAVRLDPGDAELHALAGISVGNLPDWMDQAERSRTELAEGYRLMVEAGDAAQRWTPAMRALIAEGYGRQLEGAGDEAGACEAYRVAVEAAPRTEAGRDAAQRLGVLSD